MSASLVVATLFIGGVTFLFGSVAFAIIGFVPFSILLGIWSVEPPPLLILATFAFSLAAAAILATVTARRWCQNARRRAALSASNTVGDRRVFRFTLGSFLLFQFYVALALGLIRWLGGPVVPCVGGVAGAALGYWLTLFLARRRVYDVVVSSLFGILVSAIAAAIAMPRSTRSLWSDDMRDWIVLTSLVVPPVVAFVARWRLRKWERQE
jgi:hypothetical protein